MPSPADRQTARQSILFASLPERLAETLLARARVQEHDRGATIFLQGDPADHVHVVLDGWVKLYRISPSGSVRSIAERNEAERAAWAAPGVTKVHDHIKIKPYAYA